ncbi:hypothetical protein like AT3G06240 [Hibiscus trionum]|uniref:F-box domain-containing protein n=1 Tax=Hibiscus trionum TaxID=183268 RepID=A0A9W7MIK7_HIBTR|nr:hypothetical protein like AT3G06240 [Hibiscus trionum]
MSQRGRKQAAAATGRQPNPMKHVPEDIIVGILSRQPVKSLCRFKCVSKVWRNLISGSQFVKLQLNQSINSNRLTYVLYIWLDFPRRLELDYESLVSGHEVKARADESWFGLTLLFWNRRVLGSCNGLLCVAFAPPTTIALVNPSTRESKMIYSCYGPQNDQNSLAGGFGYDALHDDYKVVKINHRMGSICVYSLKNSAWSCIRVFPHEIIGDSVHLNGVIHWITCYDSEAAPCITAFQLTKQEFSRRIPTPRSHDGFLPVQLYAMGGNLCIGGYRLRQFLYEFWVMEIYGVEESWKRIGLTFSVRSTPSILDLPRSQEALILDKGRLFIYNHRNGSRKEVNIGQIPKAYAKRCLNSGFSYVDSLVAL